MNFLEKHFPLLATKYQRLYRGAYAPDAYAKEVRGMVKMLQKKYRVSKRDETKRGEKETPGEQGASPGRSSRRRFDW